MQITLGHKREISNYGVKQLNVSHYLFLLFWILKPFYFGESGWMQVSDFVFIASFIAWLFCNDGRLIMEKKELYFLYFVGSVFLINSVYALIYLNGGFLLSASYYLYNFLVILVINDFKNNKVFLKALLWASIFNLFIQLVILLLGTGRYFWGSYRFMGSFNDPNQYAFSMFTSFLLIYLLSSYFKDQENNRKKVLVLLSYLLALYFIVQGSSTGMLLGMIVFSVLMFFSFLSSERTPAFMFLKIIAVSLAVAALAILVFGGLNPGSVAAPVDSESFLFFRLNEKLTKIDSGGIEAIIKERKIDKFFDYFEYAFFGAGEGLHTRFHGSNSEIHSTAFAILFSYGILPFLLLVKWLKLNLSRINRLLIPIYLALLIESFTLANQRQPALWMIIVLGSLVYKDVRAVQRKFRIVVPL